MQKINQGKNHNYPKDKRAWAALINSQHDAALAEREHLELLWARNIAYFYGYQHLIYDTRAKSIEIDQEISERNYVINRIAPFVEKRQAKLTRSRPTLGVLPDDNSPVKIRAAEVSQHLLRYLWKCLDKEDLLDTAVLYSVIMGSSFIKCIWDSEGGIPIMDDQDEKGNIVFDENTGQQRQIPRYLGEIKESVLNPFEFIASTGVRCIEDAEWVMQRSHMTLQELKDRYKDFDERMINANEQSLTRYERFIYNLGVPRVGGFSNAWDRANKVIKENELLLVKEYWQKPNKVYPKGILATVIGNQLVQFDSWPYDHMQFPFVKIDEHKNPMGFYGISTVTRLVPLQRHYNEVRTQIANNAQSMANVKWHVFKGAGLSNEALDDLDAEIVETNPNLPAPSQLPVAPLPGHIIQSQNQDIEDFRDISGEVAVTDSPFVGLTAGIAIEQMAEIADIGLGPTIKNIERALIKLGRQELMIANQLYTDERIVKVFGPQSGDFDIIRFKSTDLHNQTDVTLQLESALGFTKSAARQQLIDMWDRRIIQDPQMFMKAFSVGDLDIITKADAPAEAVVIEQIEMIKQGQNPVVTPFDNHVLHVKMLTSFIQTPEFQRMPPDRQQLATMALQQHLQHMGQAAQAAQPQQNQAAVGTPFGQQVTEGAPPAQA